MVYFVLSEKWRKNNKNQYKRKKFGYIYKWNVYMNVYL